MGIAIAWGFVAVMFAGFYFVNKHIEEEKSLEIRDKDKKLVAGFIIGKILSK